MGTTMTRSKRTSNVEDGSGVAVAVKPTKKSTSKSTPSAAQLKKAKTFLAKPLDESFIHYCQLQFAADPVDSDLAKRTAEAIRREVEFIDNPSFSEPMPTRSFWVKTSWRTRLPRPRPRTQLWPISRLIWLVSARPNCCLPRKKSSSSVA